MADKKISQLTALSAANVASATDVLAIVDTSATETKKITAKDLIDGALNAGTANGVLYLNGSKVATSGSTLAFDSSDRLIVGAGSAVFGSRIECVANTSGDGLRIRGRASDGTGIFSFGANAAATEYARIQSDNTSALIFGTGASGTEAMRLTSTSLYTASGINVGIGTSSPSAKLEAYRNSIGEVARFTASSDGFRGLKFISSDNTGSGAVWTRDIDSAYAQHRWAKSGTPLMVLDESGNLGVGTTTPGQKLEVAGNQRFTGSQVGTKIENRNTGINVSTATTILDEAGAEGRVVIVNGANGGDRFCDLVFCSTAANPTVIASFTAFGTPTARTYTRNGAALQLAMASGTYVVNALALGY